MDFNAEETKHMNSKIMISLNLSIFSQKSQSLEYDTD